MTKIYLIRHTQAEGNLYRMMQGHWDGDVTAQGRLQIDALARRFEGVPVDAVYSSDLYRARLTASAVTRTHALPLNTDVRLREINMGAWESEFFGNVYYRQPQETERFIRDPYNWRIPDAETYQQVSDRAYPALVEIAERHSGQAVAVVSHGVTIRCLISKITGISLRDAASVPICGNTAVTTLMYENGVFTAESINDCSHLDSLPQTEWNRVAPLRDESFDPDKEPDYYKSCYADAWTAAHGSLTGYRPEPYLKSAAEHYRQDSGAVLRFFDGERSVGLLDLDTRRGGSGGWISLIYLEEEYRRKGYGIQLLARAIKHYRQLGRDCLQLHVAADNAVAIKFYSRQGFTVTGSEQNRLGALLRMERPLKGGRENV